MFSIPEAFANEDEGYITIPALKRFAKEKKNEDLKTTVDRPQLIRDIESYGSVSEEHAEAVYSWLDTVLIEGIKDVKIKFIDPNTIFADKLGDGEYVFDVLENLLESGVQHHLCGNRYTESLQLFRFDIENDERGKSIKLYMGKLISTYDKDKGSSCIPYPIFMQIFVDKGLIVVRAKSKSGMYKFMEHFQLESADTTSVDKEMDKALKYICGNLNIETLKDTEAHNEFRKLLYNMLMRFTETPAEIKDLMNAKKEETEKMVDTLVNDICELPDKYKEDVRSNMSNMIEKYFSVSYADKKIFTKNREAYPLRLNATDEEDSKVQQVSAFEQPLQSKAIFFDNKKMLQKSELCDGCTFVFKRINTLYCKQNFKVKIVSKKDYCTLKFTEYTMEEDINNVLFSLVCSSGDNSK